MTELIAWSEKLVALAILLQSIELIQLRRTFADDGIWSWPVLRREYAGLPRWLRAGLDSVLGYRGFVGLLLVRASIAALVLLLPASAWSMGFLFLSSLAVSARWRGTFNGGSDYMTALVTLALALARAFEGLEWVAKACLAYIAAQLLLSYVIAGLFKLREASWRDGSALRAFARLPGLEVPRAVTSGLARPGVAKPAAWGVILFECAFPFALTGRSACLAFIALALLFHLANAWALGLNRFLYAWAAAYPALYYWASRGE